MSGSTTPLTRQLPVEVDVAAVEREVWALPDEAWLPHFNTRLYRGDWSGVALRTVGGAPGALYPDPNASGEWLDTPILADLPAVSAALERIRCPLLSARLLRLGPGASIGAHTDLDLSYDDGEVRLHVPIVTSPDVTFLLDGERIEMAAGECWYLDLNHTHEVRNDGDRPRIHLVVDARVNPWLGSALGFGPPAGLDPARARSGLPVSPAADRERVEPGEQVGTTPP